SVETLLENTRQRGHRGQRGPGCPALGGPCGTHTCIHIVGPPAGLAAAGSRGAACARIEDIINGALHLAVIDGLGALGGAGEEDRGQAVQVREGVRPPSTASAAPPSTSHQPPGPGQVKGHLPGTKKCQGVLQNSEIKILHTFILKYYNTKTVQYHN
uniref:Uncharacterized protein n=1 Tax=Suricata suricatta TaxID=37032 RepID=A0A673UAK9_SURSU